MVKVAIVEDNEGSFENLKNCIEKYSKAKKTEFEVEHFTNGEKFLSCETSFDLVFMDIDLPKENGMEISAKLRKNNSQILIIFVTNLAQYAVKGYEVDALDFIVKPVSYSVLSLKMDRAMDRISRSQIRNGRNILVKNNGEVSKVEVDKIKYVEIWGHKIIYHTIDGNIQSYGTLKSVEEQLSWSDFIKCNSCYLINLKFVTSVVGFIVNIDGIQLKISQSKRHSVVRALNSYMCAKD